MESNLFPENQKVSGILRDEEIEDSVSKGQLIIGKTFLQNSLEASSYDVRVGLKGVIGGEGIEIELQKNPMELAPGSYGGIISLEKFKLPADICARIGSKRALSYDGIILLTGTIVDPGYEGHLLFGLYNASQRKVIIRQGRKICNIVFEKLSKPSLKQAPSNPNLISGNFPDEFLDRMANMDVLPWMQISERVKQIEQITKDIIDLKARYEDVLQPIKDLTKNVEALSSDVESLNLVTKNISKDIESLTSNLKTNGEHISDLTNNMGIMLSQVSNIQGRIGGIEKTESDNQKELSTMKSDFKLFRLLIYIFWALLLLAAGYFLNKL
jgi:dCTP deaminase